jgi:hypothetical protein
LFSLILFYFQAQLLGVLVKLSSACARMCGRVRVEAQPDAVLAVVLMESSLRLRVRAQLYVCFISPPPPAA